MIHYKAIQGRCLCHVVTVSDTGRRSGHLSEFRMNSDTARCVESGMSIRADEWERGKGRDRGSCGISVEQGRVLGATLGASPDRRFRKPRWHKRFSDFVDFPRPIAQPRENAAIRASRGSGGSAQLMHTRPPFRGAGVAWGGSSAASSHSTTSALDVGSYTHARSRRRIRSTAATSGITSQATQPVISGPQSSDPSIPG